MIQHQDVQHGRHTPTGIHGLHAHLQLGGGFRVWGCSWDKGTDENKTKKELQSRSPRPYFPKAGSRLSVFRAKLWDLETLNHC